jgi:hypothetical protein
MDVTGFREWLHDVILAFALLVMDAGLFVGLGFMALALVLAMFCTVNKIASIFLRRTRELGAFLDFLRYRQRFKAWLATSPGDRQQICQGREHHWSDRITRLLPRSREIARMRIRIWELETALDRADGERKANWECYIGTCELLSKERRLVRALRERLSEMVAIVKRHKPRLPHD